MGEPLGSIERFAAPVCTPPHGHPCMRLRDAGRQPAPQTTEYRPVAAAPTLNASQEIPACVTQRTEVVPSRMQSTCCRNPTSLDQ